MAIIEVELNREFLLVPRIKRVQRVVLKGVTMNDFNYYYHAVPGGILVEANGVTGQYGTFRISTTGEVSKVYDYFLLKVFPYQGLYGMHYAVDGTYATEIVTSTDGTNWTPYARANADAILNFKELEQGQLIAYWNAQLLYIPQFGPDSLTTVNLNVHEIGNNTITTVASLDSTLYVGTLSGLFYRDLAEALGDGQ